MRKKLSQAAQERNKQLKRLRAAQRRAEKAGFTFDTSPIPERATTKTLSKISGMDIWKQGYKLSTSGDKEFYSPYKARQQASAKAQETIRKKIKTDKQYKAKYYEQKSYASARSQYERTRRQTAELSKILFSNNASQQEKQKAKAKYEQVGAKQKEAIEKISRYQRSKQSQFSSTTYSKPAVQPEPQLSPQPEPKTVDNDFYDYDDYDYDYSETTDYKVRKGLEEGIYTQIDQYVYDETGEPIATFEEAGEIYAHIATKSSVGIVPMEKWLKDDVQDELVVDPKTGEVYGTRAELEYFNQQTREALENGYYEESDVVILDSHSDPIAIQVNTTQGTMYVPFDPQTFSDIAESNVTDYLTALTPNMRRYLDQKIQEQKSEEGEDNFYARLKDNAPKYGYAFERVIKYGSYQELVEDFYEAASLILGGELDDYERYVMEEAVNADREYRSNAKGHIRVH